MPTRQTPSPRHPFGYFTRLRLLVVVAAALIVLAGGAPLAGALLGGAALGARRLQLDLRTERHEREEGLREATRDPRLTAAVARLSQRAGIHPCPVYLVEGLGLTASVCGARRADQAILVGRELRTVLRGQSLTAMLAHELGHAAHRDVRSGILVRTLFDAGSGVVLGTLPAFAPFGVLAALTLVVLLRPFRKSVLLLVARAVERRADRFAARLVGAEPLVRGLRQTHRHERAQLALSAALERAAQRGLPTRRVDRASAILLDPWSPTRRLISAERGLTAALPPEDQAVIRQIRRQDPWRGEPEAIYGSTRERLARIRGGFGA